MSKIPNPTTPPITPEEQRKKWVEETELQFKEEKAAEEKKEIQKETIRILKERLETPEDRNKRLVKEAKGRIKKPKEDLDNSKYEKDQAKQTWEEIRGIKSELGYGLDKKFKGIGDAIGNGLSMIAPEIAPLVAGVKSTFTFFKNMKGQKDHREELKADLEIKEKMLQESKFASEYAQKTFGITDSLYKFFTHGEKGAGKFTPRKAEAESTEPTEEREYNTPPITPKPTVGSTSEKTFAESIVPAGNGNTSEIGSEVMPLYNEQVKTNEKLDKIYNFLVGRDKTREFERREDKIASIENAEESANSAFFAKRGTSEKVGKVGHSLTNFDIIKDELIEHFLEMMGLNILLHKGGNLLRGGLGKVLGWGKGLFRKGSAGAVAVGTSEVVEAAEKVATKGSEKVVVEGAEKVATKGSEKVVVEGAEKGAVKLGEKVVVEGAEKGAVKLGEKELVKGGAKTLGKTLLKKIPLISILAGIGFGIGRLMDGDPLGAGLEVASGVAGSVPGVGTAASVAIDGGLIARDMGAFNGKDSQSPNSSSPKTGGNWFGNIAKSVAGMGFLGPAGVLLSGLFGGDDTEAKKKKMADIPEKLDEIKSVLWSIYGVLNSRGVGNGPETKSTSAVPAEGGVPLTKSAPAAPTAPTSEKAAPTAPVGVIDKSALNFGKNSGDEEHFNKSNPAAQKAMSEMAVEYKNQTGKNLNVTSAYRSYEEQAALKAKGGNYPVATPGKSKHGSGTAFDSSEGEIAYLNKKGADGQSLMDKFGFSPLKGDPVHMNFTGPASQGPQVASTPSKQNPLKNIFGSEANAAEITNTNKSGGSRAWRNNNPGNIRYNPNFPLGAIGKDKNGFSIFNNKEAGLSAMDTNLTSGKYKDLSLAGAISRWAPPSENNTGKYIEDSAKKMGMTAEQFKNTKYSSLDAKQKALFRDSIEKQEGWIAGNITPGSDSQNIAKATSTKAPSDSNSDSKYPFLTGYTPTNPNDITSAPAGSPYAKNPVASVQDQDQAKILSPFEPKQATAIPKPVETGDDISMRTRNIGYGNYPNNSNEKVPVINQTNIVTGRADSTNPKAQQRSAPGNGAKNPNTSDGLLAAASTGSLFEYLKMTF